MLAFHLNILLGELLKSAYLLIEFFIFLLLTFKSSWWSHVNKIDVFSAHLLPQGQLKQRINCHVLTNQIKDGVCDHQRTGPTLDTDRALWSSVVSKAGWNLTDPLSPAEELVGVPCFP